MIRELILSNWLFLLPIVALSVMAMAIVVERVAFFIRIRPKGREPLTETLKNLRKRPLRETYESLSEEDRSPAAVLLRYALKSRLHYTPEAYRGRLEAMKERAFDRMERRLPLLPGIANVATLLGLFGTVSGMITAFHRMTEAGSSDPYVLAGGISRALVTTAAGLAAAIPALFAHHLLVAAADRHDESMEFVVAEAMTLTGAGHVRERKTTTS